MYIYIKTNWKKAAHSNAEKIELEQRQKSFRESEKMCD